MLKISAYLFIYVDLINYNIYNYLKVKSEDNLERSVHILSLSAKTEKALADLVNNYQDYLEADNKDNELADICYTANIGRADFDHRLAFIQM